jgi:hypothetical protein
MSDLIISDTIKEILDKYIISINISKQRNNFVVNLVWYDGDAIGMDIELDKALFKAYEDLMEFIAYVESFEKK